MIEEVDVYEPDPYAVAPVEVRCDGCGPIEIEDIDWSDGASCSKCDDEVLVKFL